MSEHVSSQVRFGKYLLDRADERLIGPQGPVRIGNKAFRVIDAMTQSRGRLLTKDELFDTVWDGTSVSDSALTSVVKELRRALNDDPHVPEFIESVYGRGYRFVCEVQEVTGVERQLTPASQLRLTGVIETGLSRASERRLVTVISVELIDISRGPAETDPEELAEVFLRCQSSATDAIAAAGGSIVSATGDGLLACFGWPDAREDAAERAVRAAFSVIEDVGHLGRGNEPSLRPRIGIATGIVIVGGHVEDTTFNVSLIGEAPILAAELRRISEPGTIAISEHTRRQVGQLFHCELVSGGLIGKAGAELRAWRPLRVAPNMTRFRAARTASHNYLGRLHELALLADRWRTAASGRGRTVVILGEAGIGKSRLVEELRGKVIDGPHQLIVWQCSPYYQAKPLYPVLDYFTFSAGILASDNSVEQLAKLATLLTSAQFRLEGNLAFLAHLLFIPPDAGYALPPIPAKELRAATIAALVDWLRHLSAIKPLLFILEDAHWIDPTTLEVLSQLVSSLDNTPILAAITARPEFASRWSDRAEVSTIGLDRLSELDCAKLAQEVVGAAESTEEIIAEVVARSDGNPLYVEELSAAVSGPQASATTRVPDSLQGSLVARLDALGDARQVAQKCSVLGRRFYRSLLSHVSGLSASQLDASLALLIEHKIVKLVNGAGEDLYEFKHALLRDAAYESMLTDTRRKLHVACARSIEEHLPRTAQAQPELLAQHFGLAGLSVEAGSYAELAGDRSSAACAFQETIANYQDAIKQNDAQPPSVDRDRRELDLLLKLGPAVALFRGAQDIGLREIYNRAEALSRVVGDIKASFKAVWGLWYNANISRELDDAGDLAQRLVTIAEESGDEDLGLEASHCRWSTALFSADYRKCLADARQGTQLYDRHRHHKLGLVFGGHDPGVCAFGCQGQAQVYAGEVSLGFASVEKAIALGNELDHPGTQAHGLLMGLIVGTVAHDLERLQLYAESTVELSRRFKLPPQEVIGTYHLAWLDAEAGSRDNGLSEMSALYDRVTAIGPITLLYKVMYVEQLLKASRPGQALAEADRAIAALHCPDRGLLLSELLRLRGECLFMLGRNVDGSSQLVRAETMAKRDGAGLLRLRAARSLHNFLGEPSRATLDAAIAGMPSDWSAAEKLDARSVFLA